MQPVTITLNGHEVSGYSGMTILELARESGIYIPTLCHDTHLSPVGACRVCLVEDEQSGRLVASCAIEIMPGMVINTESPRVIEHRKTIIKLMLASHPDTCLVCDKGNLCQLREIAADLGIGLIDFERIPKAATIEEVNPFIERDLSKCILCAKCIRACQELVVEGAVDYFQRGFITKPATLNDSPLEDSECTFCGTCVAMCPTGALMEKDRTYTGTSNTTVTTTCPYCGCGCSVRLEVKDNQLLRVTPGEENEINKGALCVKGSYGLGFIHAPDRLTKPLVRSDGDLEQVSWEKALATVAAEFKQIKNEYGPDSLAVLGSPRCTNEENYLLQRFARCVLGTNNIDNGGRLYKIIEPVIPGSEVNPIDAIEGSEVLIVIGADPTSSAPIIGYAIKRAVKSKGAKLILIDPRRTGLTSFTHLWLRPRIGTDTALLNSLAKVITDENLLDRDSIIQNKDNYEEWIKVLEKYSPDNVEAITGVSIEAILNAARVYATANQSTIIYGTGITQQTDGADTLKALSNLAVLTSTTEHTKSSIHALQRDCNSQGACDMGALPDFLPGYLSTTDTNVRTRFEKLWNVELPARSGLTVLEIIEQARKGNIKGMWIIGENPVLSFPNRQMVTEALSALDFLVVQDMFLTETAELANVVLPAVSFAEKGGTFTGFGGMINKVRMAINPIGESLPDWEIVLKLAESMKQPLPFSSLQQVSDEMRKVVLLDQKSQLSNKATGFLTVDYNPEKDDNKDGYPFTLLTGTTRYHHGSGTRSSRAWRLKKHSPLPLLEISESDAATLKINNGDTVSIASPANELSLPISITTTVPEGVLYIPSSFPEISVNRMFDSTLQPVTKMPSFKACKVRIERAKANDE
ncbi:molybdopterin-dependent oxidoreductase [Chloroflexota bacterium]